MRLLQGAALRVQVGVVVALVPVVAALLGLTLVPLAVEVALEDADRDVVDAAVDAVRIVAWLLVGCIAIAAAGVAMVLRASLGAVVDRLHDATDAVARGDFRHRVATRRSDELGRLGASIDAMAERLEGLEQARRRLLAGVSHELRTPLTIIQGHAFTLARMERDDAARARLDLVQSESMRLAQLIEDLVDASSLHAGSVRLSPERVDLDDLARIAAARFANEAEAAGTDIRVTCDRRRALVVADPGRVEQVLANLLSNAIRHAPGGSTIEVGVARTGGRRGPCSITVANEGTAIAPELADRIFEPFVQGDRDVGRVGLGLAIAHGIAVAHGGSLELLPTGAGRRVEFRLVLPGTAAGGGIEAGSPAASAPVQRFRGAPVRTAMVEP